MRARKRRADHQHRIVTVTVGVTRGVKQARREARRGWGRREDQAKHEDGWPFHANAFGVLLRSPQTPHAATRSTHMMSTQIDASACRLPVTDRRPPVVGAIPAVVRSLANVTVIEEYVPIGDAAGETASYSERPGMIAVVFIRAGRLYGRVGQHEVAVAQGGLVIWQTSLPATFRAAAPVHRFTFLFSERDLARRASSGAVGCRTIHREHALGTVVASFFDGLTHRLDALTDQQAQSAVAMTRDVVNRAILAASSSESRDATDNLVERILEHIDRELGDSKLRPGSVAKTHGISIRYLHLLFARRGLGVASLIRERRLDACRADLATAPDDVTISSIALRWGFTDSSHFSRLFSSTYGISPLGYRRQQRSGG